MKRRRDKVSTRVVRKALGIHSTSIGAILLLTATAAPAVDRVWDPPEGNDWNSYFNWSPPLPPAPVDPGSNAIFDISPVTNPTLSDNVTIESIIFNPVANSYTIQTAGNILTLQGAGIVNNSGSVQTINNESIEGSSGQTIFGNSATAGNATINNNGFNTVTSFLDNSTAGNATINNLFGATVFLGNSTAGNATLNNTGAGSFAAFFGNSTAGNATINTSGAGSFVTFNQNSTAGNSTINSSGPGSGPDFFENSTAGNATINNSGTGSFATFNQNSTAGNATIVNSGEGSFTIFANGASGGNSAWINSNPTAFMTIAELDGAGTTAGSIAGSGTIFLGSKNLTVGGNQQSTVFSGVIADGESPNLPGFPRTQPSYIGGSLTKVGTGTLTLAGANTYTGGTTIAEGTLLTQNASALGTGPVAFGNGATLEVQNLLNLNGNWTVSPGTATVSGGAVQTFGEFNLGGGGTLIANSKFSVPGAANINGSGLVVNDSSPPMATSTSMVAAPGLLMGCLRLR